MSCIYSKVFVFNAIDHCIVNQLMFYILEKLFFSDYSHYNSLVSPCLWAKQSAVINKKPYLLTIDIFFILQLRYTKGMRYICIIINNILLTSKFINYEQSRIN